MDHIPVHIGADALKKTLYDAVIPRWNRWSNNFPLHINQITMRDKFWVILKPNVPDRDVIARHFFKSGKKGVQTFKSGKTVINFHIPNEIYYAMLEKRDAGNELVAKKKAVVMRNDEIEQSVAADFTVGALMCFGCYIIETRNRLL